MAKQFDKFTVRADGLDGKKATEYEATVMGMLRSYGAFKMGRALLNGFRAAWWSRDEGATITTAFTARRLDTTGQACPCEGER